MTEQEIVNDALKKGQKIEIVILANEDDELESIRDHIAAQNITETDISDAIHWARES